MSTETAHAEGDVVGAGAEHPDADDQVRRPRRRRTVVIAVVSVLALVLAVGIPTAIAYVDRQNRSESARADAAAIVASHVIAVASREETLAAMAEASSFNDDVLAPVLAIGAEDSAHFSDDAVAAVREVHERLAELSAAEVSPLRLGPGFGEVGTVEENLIQAYLSSDDVEASRADSADEEERLASLENAYAMQGEAVVTALDESFAAIRTVAEAGIASGTATLAEHARATEEHRAGLTAAVESLQGLAETIDDPAVRDSVRTAEILPADMLSAYRASAVAVRDSHAEVLEAERIEAERAAAERAAAEQASRQRSSGNSNGGSSGNSGGGGGSRTCTYLGFGGTVNIRPC